MAAGHLELDAEYYITKNLIPPLERIFNLVGANVRTWYDEVPKIQRNRRVEVRDFYEGKNAGIAKRTLEFYLKSTHCVVCRNKAESNVPVCGVCLSQTEAFLLKHERRTMEPAKK
ncbi:MAG: DNA polymerase zeta [Phylliscum demangeonii]|nr:MAG: DNA polymerase zeta [Phylliscum demangeonii]